MAPHARPSVSTAARGVVPGGAVSARRPSDPVACGRSGEPTGDSSALRNALVFWGSLAALLALTLAALFQAGALLTRPPAAKPIAAKPIPGTPVAQPVPTTLSATVVDGNVAAYALPNPDAGLMQPSIAPNGTVWFGEMTTNQLGMLDPASGQVRAWTPPNGKNTIMTTQVDSAGRVYFAEQAGNYIGRFDPATRTFKTFALPLTNGHSSGPQDLRFDSSGAVWVTLASGAAIGRLDPNTGALQTYPVPSPGAGETSDPWALAIASTGQVWFGMLTGGVVGWVDPQTGQVSLIHLADSQAQIFSMAADGQGRVYFSEMQAGKLGVIDTATGKVRELSVPNVLGDPTSLYAVTCANGSAWIASSGANAIIRFDPVPGAFTFYKLPTPNSIPYGLAVDRRGHVWFAADDTAGNYIGELTP